MSRMSKYAQASRRGVKSVATMRLLVIGIFVLAAAALVYTSTISTRYRYIFLDSSEGDVLEDNGDSSGHGKRKVILEPAFDLNAINAACNLTIPEEMFTTCRNQVYPRTNRFTNETQMAISPRIHMLGERHSGTNLAAALAKRNFDLVYNKTLVPTRFPIPFPQSDYGINRHKHNIQVDGPYERGLSIISIRNPYDYASAMTDICYECGPQKHNRQNPEVFIGTPWHGGNHADDHRFDNLMAMRRDKYCNYLEKAAKLTDCIMMVHSEDNMLPVHQERFVWRMAMLTGWPLKGKQPSSKGDYSGHADGRGFKLSNLIDKTLFFKDQYTEKERRVIKTVNEVMEEDFEKALGYKSLVLPEEPRVSSETQEHPNAQGQGEVPESRQQEEDPLQAQQGQEAAKAQQGQEAAKAQQGQEEASDASRKTDVPESSRTLSD